MSAAPTQVDARSRPSLLVITAFAVVALASVFGKATDRAEQSGAGATPGVSPVRTASPRRNRPAESDDAGTAEPQGLRLAKPIEHAPGLAGVAKAVLARFGRDNVTLVAAGVAYYIFLSIFPALAALVSIYGLFSDPAEVGRQIAPLASLLPPEAMKLLNDGLQTFIQGSAGARFSIALIVSVALALWTARAAMSSIMTGLNIVYEEPERRSFIKQTLVSLGLTVGAVVLAALCILAVAVVPAILAFVRLDKLFAMLLAYGRWPILTILVGLGIAVLYRFAPDRSHPKGRWISWGSAIATLLWLIGSLLLSLYVTRFGSYDATYGSLGAVVVLLLWFWFSAVVLLLGAEIEAELEARDDKAGDPMGALPTGQGGPATAP